jgi:hypothetical protein
MHACSILITISLVEHEISPELDNNKIEVRWYAYCTSLPVLLFTASRPFFESVTHKTPETHLIRIRWH